MPGNEIWTLYPALGILIAIMVVMGVALRFIWKEFKLWLEGQNAERTVERNTQRAWEAEQSKAWRDFIADIERGHVYEENRNRETLANVASSMRQIATVVELLNKTLVEHILEDSARFDVLLNPEQKSAIEDRKTQPRKKGA